ncbi:hypothetical protein BBBOND_0106670 [Babesia bigemina]|uniref:Uncharacterized protein n=1 Tax=Babesia bigemina TaxID=5866 RepID=A0A061D153_BABBI|nr:hypothetical protein BBBOND_0106670 [Babesia bigemina]CDR94358.1 hypothetical protein BBBOND_0106670 [Babesia bigemina]|eukprot:XP_012766544.1 hypothetical protein BBBOND_0106670 [Babesia bigemina]
MLNTPAIRQLSRCISLRSNKSQFPWIPTSNAFEIVTSVPICAESWPVYPCVGVNVINALTPTLANQVLRTPHHIGAQQVEFRRHRGGKVKNKLRNIEKRKKREQNMHRLSSDVKFNIRTGPADAAST